MAEIPFQNLAFLILVVLVVYSVASIIIWTLRNKISPMPTLPTAKRTMFSVLPSLSNGTIYELGAGWGTLALPLAQHYPNSTVIAFETSPVPFYFSYLSEKIRGLPNLVVKKSDFFNENLSGASMVVCYLYPDAMSRLKPKLENELRPGTWVVSNTFAIPGWDPENVENVNDLLGSKIYIYRVPAQQNGR